MSRHVTDGWVADVGFHTLSKIPKLECIVYDNDNKKKKKSWMCFEKEGLREKMFFI